MRINKDTSGDSNERREIIPEHIGTIDETIPEEVYVVQLHEVAIVTLTH